ncbi:MAG: phospholipase D-like domain-containing protein [Nocardioides sp.]
MRRAGAVLVAAAVLLTGQAGLSSAAPAYSPAPGAIFNNPRGDLAARDRILSHIVKTIEGTRRHSNIRIAAYSLDRPDVVDARTRAHRRGVDVQLVLNDNWTSPATRRLTRTLGTDTDRRSFVTVCVASCRGGAGNQHMKFYLFSKAGPVKDVVMIGSSNLTGYAAKTQWNDMYTVVGKPKLRDLYTKVFEQLVRNRRLEDPSIHRTVGVFENEFGPFPDTTKNTDPVMERLREVSCSAGSSTGTNGRTVIRVVMYGWSSDRGLYLAEKVADLSRSGCNVRVIVSSGGRKVVGTLKRGGVLVRSADLDLDYDDTTGFGGTAFEVFTHQKYMLLSGGFRGKQSWQVWSGSENWSGMGLINDEVTIRIPRRTAYQRYLENFSYVWSTWSRAL